MRLLRLSLKKRRQRKNKRKSYGTFNSVHRLFKSYIYSKQSLIAMGSNIFKKGSFIMKYPVVSKKAVCNNQRYRKDKTRNTFYGRHDLLKKFKVNTKLRSWKEEI